jgi:hypothetical protein
MRRISSNLMTAFKFVTILLLLGAMGVAQTTVNLTAQKSTTTMPDGKTVPMWGFCTIGSCSAQWTAGPTIVVPAGNSLTVSLTNNLPTPTSFVILGQINGGGVGSPNKVAGPEHLPQVTTTWPGNGTAVFNPPTQGKRVQSFGSEASANGGTQTYSWDKLAPGTYIYESGTQPSIQVPMGLYGVVVVTTAPVSTTDANNVTTLTAGTAYPAGKNAAASYSAITYDADAVVLTSEVDAVQNAAVDAANGDASKYPAAVNYRPTYFLVNGHPFDVTVPNTVTVGATASSGNVLVRFANAGSRTHIPTIVGLPMAVVAEDGNVLPGNPRVQSEVLLTAGKTHDIIVKPTSASGTYAIGTFGIFDRALMLSSGNKPNSGLQAYLLVNGGALPAGAAGLTAAAVDDTFVVPLNSTTFTGNILNNDIGITSATLGNAPNNGTVTFNADGTFTYTPTGATVVADIFTYVGNGSSTATVTLTLATLGSAPSSSDDSFASNIANYIKVPRPGVLGNDVDPTGFVLTAKAGADKPAWVTLNADGSITAAPPAGTPSVTFTYTAVNSQGTSSVPANVTLNFAKATGLKVTFSDALTKAGLNMTDYRWMIEEDQTFHNDNALTPNSATGPTNSLGTNFHRSYMNVVATGCTGPKSCNEGQTINGAAAPSYEKTTPDQVYLDPNKYYYISILPGDAGDPATGAADTGHTMSGATIGPGQLAVNILLEESPLPPAQMSIFVFEDNNPTNGDVDGPEEAQGLGGFSIVINDARGATGDPAGQMTYDAFNMPITNYLAQLRPDLCPLTPDAAGLQGQVITCPEKDIHGNPSPLAGHALIKNISPGRYDVLVNPSAAREGKGENWIQVSTLEGTRANDAFTKAGEPPYFQEFGSPGFHAFVGFFNPAHVPAAAGTNAIKGRIVNLHMSRPSKVDLLNGSHEPLSASTCYVGLNSNAGNGQNVAFAQCDDNGNFTLSGVAPGAYQIVVWDQWLDQIIDYHDVTIPAGSSGKTYPAATQTADCPFGCIGEFSWFTRVITRTFLDDGTHKASDNTPGVAQVPFTIRYRDGSFSNTSLTDSSGTANFAELFPLFNWYVMESDTTRYKGTAVHVVVDGGGQPDTAGPYAGILNSHYPTGETTERFDSGNVLSEGLQGFISQTQITEWGKRPYNVGENGGIQGTIVYSSTRPFDDPRYLVQNLWEPLVPRVTINLYSESTAPDGSQLLKLVNTAKSSSFDDATASLSCPGQDPADPFVSQTLGSNVTKCYDGFHAWNQVQPLVYDGRYQFTTIYPGGIKADGTPVVAGETPVAMPTGNYVVEVVPPPGYDIVKEEDKNILIGDTWIAPDVQQFGALGSIFILPDQATLNNAIPGSQLPLPAQSCQLDASGNPIASTCVNYANNATTDLGMTNGGNSFPSCVGNLHRVPDYLTLYGAGTEGSGQVAPFAGADRPLCDRKEVTLSDQMQATANFYLFTPVPGAAHFTGMILNDASAEFNPVNPDYGEKFAVPFVPVSIRDFNGVEINRVYSDQWGMFNGLAPSSWQVNVPTPAGYGPDMLITCMNDPGPIPDGNGGLMTDPAYNPMYSNFCYTLPFMPSTTVYLDTPVLPIAAFASHYTRVDCAYPDATPAIKRVDASVGFGPYLPKGGGTLTIQALGTVEVPNPDYEGPTATAAPHNQRTIQRTYHFGTTPGSVSIGGVTLDPNNVSWGDTSITVTVPNNTTGGQLVVTTAAGKQTVESVNVVIEDQQPTRVSASGAGDYKSIQDAIDNAKPGDLILVDAGTYNELVIMDRPVRLQGVGANSVIINAAKYPTTKLDAWRPRINTLFGIDQDGNQTLPALVDPLPGQEITGGVVLLEPSVLGTEEGPGIAVLAKNANALACLVKNTSNTNYLRNFNCGASRIDGISVTGGDSGGGIFVNGWAHNLEISNNRVYGNAGTMNGGIRVGVPYLEGLTLTAQQANSGYGFNKNLRLHNNAVNMNGMIEPTGGSIGAGGGITLASGTDNYSINYNYVCGNYSMGDGGGIAHIGYSSNGSITHNTIIFNQSYQQSGNVHGGGIVIESEPSTIGVQTPGTGNVTIDANLIQGNFAESGNGGGIRLQDMNGAETSFRGHGPWAAHVTNNMVVNNVAGLSGGGISVRSSSAVTIENNTVANNDAVTIVATNIAGNRSTPNPAGISSEPGANGVASRPTIINDIVWQNRSFYFDASSGAPLICSSNTASNASCVQLAAQTHVGDCDSSAHYWDLGVVGDTKPGTTLSASYSVLTPATYALPAYAAATAHNRNGDPNFQGSYCNGTGNTNVFKGFNAAATIDEAGNYVDLRYGPLTQMKDVTTYFGDYHVATPSAAIDNGTAGTGATVAPKHDFDNDVRPQGAGYDVGADEFQLFALSPSSLAFPDTQVGQTSAVQTLTLTNKTTGALTLSFATSGNTADFVITNGCGGSLAGTSSCTISVSFKPTVASARSASLNITVNGAVTAVPLTGTGRRESASVSPALYSFGTVYVGLTKAADFTITNTGVGPLTITGTTTSGDYSAAPSCAGTVNPGATCVVTVTFKPAGTGLRFGNLGVSIGGAAPPVLPVGAILTGTGVLAARYSPTSLSFSPPSIPRGSKSAVKTVTFTNLANVSVTPVFTIGGNNPTYFSQTNSCGSVAANGTCTISVSFNPPAINAGGTTGNKSATLSYGGASVALTGTAN